MSDQCKICGKTTDLHRLTFEDWETDSDQMWSTLVCGSCWKIIAAIARRGVANRLNTLTNRVDQLEEQLAKMNAALETGYFFK